MCLWLLNLQKHTHDGISENGILFCHKISNFKIKIEKIGVFTDNKNGNCQDRNIVRAIDSLVALNVQPFAF